MNQIKRVALEVAISIAVLAVFFSGVYEAVSPAMQVVALKAMLVSVGLLHAHVAGKLFFPTVDWMGKLYPAHMIRMGLYVAVPYCYALGG